MRIARIARAAAWLLYDTAAMFFVYGGLYIFAATLLR